MYDLLITNATIVTVNSDAQIIPRGYLAVSGALIAKIGSMDECDTTQVGAKTHIDASGCVVFPGFINVHTHSYQSLLKGLACDKPLSEWLATMALPAAKALDSNLSYIGSLLCAIENVHSGVTTVVDMYPKTQAEYCASVLRGYHNVGIDAIYAAGYMHDGEKVDEDLLHTQRNLQDLLQQYACSESYFAPIMLAPFQVWNNSRASLTLTAKLSRDYNVRVTTHALETAFDHKSCMERFGASELETLRSFGLLNDRLALVHGAGATEQDIDLMGQHGVSLAYSPVCNMFLGSGIAPIARMQAAGVNIALCTEGGACNNSNNMLESLKFGALVQKAALKDAQTLRAYEMLEMATINAARLLGLDNAIGSLEVGKVANLFVFDPKASSTAVPLHSPVSTLVYSSDVHNVQTVVVRGEVVLFEGRCTGVQESAILEQAQESATLLAKRARIDHLV